jgi:hypothetical protein
MREMRWSWDDFQNAPLYVRRYCWDLMNIRRRVEGERAERRSSGGQR